MSGDLAHHPAGRRGREAGGQSRDRAAGRRGGARETGRQVLAVDEDFDGVGPIPLKSREGADRAELMGAGSRCGERQPQNAEVGSPEP